MQTLWQDLRYGARMLMKQPGFTAVIILTLALGVGVNTALFTVFNVFVLKPLPLKDAETVVEIRGVNARGESENRFSYPDALDYRARAQTVAGLVLLSDVGVTMDVERTGRNAAAVSREEFGYVPGQLVSVNYFSVLGAELALGRGAEVCAVAQGSRHPDGSGLARRR